MKKDIIAVSCGVFIWLVLNTLLFANLLNLLLNNEISPLFFKLLFFLSSFIVGFFVGFLGKSKGWLLGLSTQIIIALFYILFFYTDSFTLLEIEEIGNFKALTNHLITQIPLICLATIGGYFGERVRIRTVAK